MDFLVEPTDSLNGEVFIPGDKSISHRAIMCASLASGTSTLKGFLESEDCLATLKAFQEMGIESFKKGENLEIAGKGLYGLKKPSSKLNLGNSGTAMRLMSGVLVGQNFGSLLTGDSSLLKRPMNRIIEPLSEMGFYIKSVKKGTPPLEISKTTKVNSIDYKMPINSAQVKSCLMFAALYANDPSVIYEKVVSRDHTEKMFKQFGVKVETTSSNLGNKIVVHPPRNIKPSNIEICSDFSSASFFILSGLISPNSHIVLRNIGINKTRTGLLEALQEMGGDIRVNAISNNYEPTADIEVKTSNLKAINLNQDLIPNLIDELPLLFVAASLAKGKTTINGIEELKHKESNRLDSMSKSLKEFGVDFIVKNEGIDIFGLDQSTTKSANKSAPFKEAKINSFGDHRIAMASVIASLRAQGTCRIIDCKNISTSFPNFLGICKKLGMKIRSV